MRSECGAHGGGNALRHLEFSRAITPIPVSLRIFLVRKAQHAYKCVVLPDGASVPGPGREDPVSMHLQVRGAP